MSANPSPRPNWQAELRRAFSSLQELLDALDLRAADCGIAAEAARDFPLRVPRSFVARMRRGDPRDPLLLQVLPSWREGELVPGFIADPVGDLDSVRSAGLLQKYAGRVLLIATGACAVHCRYCFRRAFPYAEQSLSSATYAKALDEIAADPGIHEVILSGGDPLVLGNARLGELLADLGRIPHLRRIRIHTRVPVVLPERVDEELLAILRSARKPLVIVIHANHARELDGPVQPALEALRDAPATLLNQSVLLRGVNDSADAIVELSEALFRCGVLPYYLHQLDAVSGAAHFAVPDGEALDLMREAQARLPGYLLPRLARERAGAAAKTLLGPFQGT